MTRLLTYEAITPGVVTHLLHPQKTQVVCSLRQGIKCHYHLNDFGSQLYNSEIWFSDAQDFCYGVAAVRRRRRWLFIKENGRPVNRWRFSAVSDMNSNGIAEVCHFRLPPEIDYASFHVLSGRFVDPEIDALMH